MRYYNDPVMSATVSASGTTNGTAVNVQLARFASVQAVVTSTANGTLKLQVSNDDNGSATNWSDLTGATVSISGANTYLIPAQNMSYQWIRAVYTASSGSGTIVVNMHVVGF